MRIDTKSMSYEEWKETRRKGIGGSDVAAVMGLSRFKSPYTLYLEKTGQIINMVDHEYVYWGKILEEIVAKEFADQTGKKVHKVHSILIHEKYPWMIANIDRKVTGENAILECKTTSAWNAKEWQNDEVPQEYILQVQHYLAVTNFEYAYIAVLIGGNHFVWKQINRDEELIKEIIEAEKDFWFHVEAKIPPEPDGSNSTTETLEKMYPDATDDSTLPLPSDLDRLIEERNALMDQIKQLTEMKTEKENKIKSLLGEHETGATDRYIVSWKPVKSFRFDSKRFKKENEELYQKYAKETSYRRLTIKEVKK